MGIVYTGLSGHLLETFVIMYFNGKSLELHPAFEYQVFNSEQEAYTALINYNGPDQMFSIIKILNRIKSVL